MNAAIAQADTERRESLIDLLLWEKRVALLQHPAQVGPDNVGDDSMTHGVRVKAVVEIQVAVPYDSEENERHERYIVSIGQPREYAMELDCITQSSNGRCLHLAQQYTDSSCLRTLDHRRDVAF